MQGDPPQPRPPRVRPTRAAAATAGLVLSLGLAAVPGCITAAPYVNIPPQAGDTLARHDVNARNVRDAAALGLQAVLTRRPLEGRAELRLPDGATNLTYADLAFRAAPEGSLPLLTPFDPGEPASLVEVTGIRLRGTKGTIDVVRPGRGGIRQLATADLRYSPVSGWSVKDVRFLNAPVTDQLLNPLPAPDAPAAPPAPPQAQPDADDAPAPVVDAPGA